MENITTKAFGNSRVDNDIAYFRKLKRKKAFAVTGKVVVYLILGFWTLTVLFPFLWTLLNSLKTTEFIRTNPFAIENLSLVNFKWVFGPKCTVDVFPGFGWSILISSVVVVACALIAAFASFFIARYQGWYTKVVYGLVIACMMFPIFSTIYPVRTFFQNHTSWLDFGSKTSYWAVIFPQVAGNLAFTITLLTGFIKSLPLEVEESAYMDGASTLRTIFTIVFPMIKSAFATSAIFIFIWSYNDLFVQRVMLFNTAIEPICLLMTKMTTKETGFQAGYALAVVLLTAVPIMVVYVCLQRFIIKGLTAGAVKG